MTYYHNTPENVQHLVDLIPGMFGSVADAWLRCEGQATNNPSNPLNILYYGREDRGQIGSRGRFAVYATPVMGLRDAAWLITRSAYYEGVREALRRHGRTSGDPEPIAISQAIEESPWAGGHYGGAGSRDGCIVRNTHSEPSPQPRPRPRPHPTKERIYVVRAGDSLWKIAEHFYHNGNQWGRIYNANRHRIGDDPGLIHAGLRLVIP